MKNNILATASFRLAVVALFLATSVSVAGAQPACGLVLKNPRCEYLTDPTGLDEPKPRFSWNFSAADPTNYGQRQTAYQIKVSDGAEAVWDSGWVESDQMQLIEYAGKPLRSDRLYSWTVAVKDEKGAASAPRRAGTWTTGILDPSQWSARWIGSDQLFDRDIGIKKGDCNIDDPWLRKTFELKNKPEKATLFIASIGYHEIYVNGTRLGDDVLAPAVSDHTKRARYVAYDIAPHLKRGRNVIGLWLGTSWSIFSGYQDPGGDAKTDLPRTPIVLAQADLYAKISDEKPVLRIATDESWKTKPSPNKLLGTWDFRNMGGELWDDNRAEPNWNAADYDDSAWRAVTVYRPRLALSAQRVEKNRLFAPIKAVAVEERGEGVYRFDMGVNFAGWTEIKLTGEPGKRIDIRFSERVRDETTFNNYSAFILGPAGKGTFRNRFNYGSGRWVTVKGLKEKPSLDDIRGWMVRTDFDRVTQFECSDPLQNWIYETVCWTLENLSLGGFVVDCPQRERMGYGGDAHATSETALFNYRLGAFYSKWLEDWRDTQGTEPMVGDMNNPAWARKAVTSGRLLGGGIQPHTAPTYWGGGGPAWGGICVTLPWILYQHEGDVRVLRQNFDMIVRWLEFLDAHVENELLKRFGGQWDFLGDWLWPNATAEGMNNDSPQTICLNNCYRVYNLRTAAKIARTIGRTDQAERWEKQAESSARAIREKYYDQEDHSYADGSMACLAAALLGEVVPPQERDRVFRRLEKEILEVRKGHIHVGITGGAMLFKVLRDAGRDDLIYAMTSKTDYPSWGFMRLNDATTIWEMWEKDLPGHSLLHSSYLYPGAWYVDGVAGVKRDPEHPGFKRFVIRPPLLDGDKIAFSRVRFDSPAGKIEVHWRFRDGNTTVEVAVPPNTGATLYFPFAKVFSHGPLDPERDTSETPVRLDGREYRVYYLQPGSYTFTTDQSEILLKTRRAFFPEDMERAYHKALVEETDARQDRPETNTRSSTPRRRSGPLQGARRRR